MPQSHSTEDYNAEVNANDVAVVCAALLGVLLIPALAAGALLWWTLRRCGRLTWVAIAAAGFAVSAALDLHRRLLPAVRDVALLTFDVLQKLGTRFGWVEQSYDVNVDLVNPVLGACMLGVTFACVLGIIGVDSVAGSLRVRIDTSKVPKRQRSGTSVESLRDAYVPAPHAPAHVPDVRVPAARVPAARVPAAPARQAPQVEIVETPAGALAAATHADSDHALAELRGLARLGDSWGLGGLAAPMATQGSLFDSGHCGPRFA
ncbi:MAG: hypothetical protein GY901_12055 [Actinomycetia bacterium]|nr:hypothetical protein [Actinomycetes bacterium]